MSSIYLIVVYTAYTHNIHSMRLCSISPPQTAVLNYNQPLNRLNVATSLLRVSTHIRNLSPFVRAGRNCLPESKGATTLTLHQPQQHPSRSRLHARTRTTLLSARCGAPHPNPVSNDRASARIHTHPYIYGVGHEYMSFLWFINGTLSRDARERVSCLIAYYIREIDGTLDAYSVLYTQSPTLCTRYLCGTDVCLRVYFLIYYIMYGVHNKE